MARIYLQDNANTNPIGGPAEQDDIIGTNGIQTVNLNANADVTFDASFNQGGDVINIAGAAALYQASVIDGNLVISSDNGADIVIPLGTDGITINFGDDQSFVALIDGGAIFLGDIEVPLDGTEVDIDEGGVTPPPPPGEGNEIYLDATRDVLTAEDDGVTDDGDTFIADIIQNQNGEQTNSLGTGDRLDGQGGDDLLQAQVQDASALNASPSSAIRPIMNDVETAHFNATQWYDGADEEFCNLALGVRINAQQTFGTTEWGSVGSDTSLTIYNVNTLPDNSTVGNDDDAQVTSILTVRMDHTGPATPTDDAANLTVLLDNDYLLASPPVVGSSSLTLQLLDIDNQIGGTPESPAGGQPLLTNPFNILRITVDGVSHDIVFDGDNNLSGIAAYNQLVASINAGLDAAGLTTLEATVNGTFTVVDPDGDPGGNASGYEVVITDSAGGDLGALGFLASDIVPPNTDYQKQVFNTPPEITDQLITINVVLNKVGREGDGGYLTAGGMALLGADHYYDSLLDNTWQYGEIEHPGIEQFNVVVEGSSNQPSSLAGLQSTHNALQVVNVASAEGSEADLTIGNSQTHSADQINGALWGKGMVRSIELIDLPIDEISYDECCVEDNFGCDLTTVKNAGLKDVRVFDSTEFLNDATVHGYFSSEVVGKYLDLMDVQDDPRGDNLVANYTFGQGNDLLNLNFSKDYYAYAGTINREDFEFIADMGNGDDHVQIQIGNGASWGEGEDCQGRRPDDIDVPPQVDAMVQHWYANHAINSFADSGQRIGEFDRQANFQLDISTGNGNDFVELWGSTVAHVNLGAGNDLIYTDNSGVCDDEFNCGMATWTFNSTHGLDIDNLLTLEPGTTGVRVANVGLVVSFQGIETDISIVGGSNATNGAILSDLQVNQAIKDAINNDPVLSGLLVALDGPGRTLIVQSLIDGEHVEEDLVISLVNTGALTAQQTASGAILIGSSATASAGIGFNTDGTAMTAPDVDGRPNRFDSFFAKDDGKIDGKDSYNVNNNVVEGSTGNDTIVLSSNGVGDNEYEGSSVETVVITGAFGEDTVLNFTAAVTDDAQVEIQTITIGGAIATSATNPTGAGTVSITYYGTTGVNVATVTVDANGADATNPTTPTEIAAALVAIINGQANDATASNVGGVITLTYDADTAGQNIDDSTCLIAPNPGENEVQTVNFEDLGNAQVTQFTVTFTFDPDLGIAPVSKTYVVADGATIPDATVAADMAALVNTAGLTAAVLPDAGDAGDTDIVQITYPEAAGNVDPVIVSVASANAVTLNAAVTSVDGYDYGLTCDELTVQDGLPGAPGWDIFDVTKVIGGAVVEVRNDQPAYTAEPDGAVYDEAAAINWVGTSGVDNRVAITDTVSSGDQAGADELTRIRTILSTNDAGNVTAYDGILITVDADNRGYFYHVVNAAGAGNATANYLGSVELGDYVDDSKYEIGNWDEMTIANFTPLNANTVTDTFNIA